MKSFNILLVALAMTLCLVSAEGLTEQQYEGLFAKYLQKFGKKYETGDLTKRYGIFKDNLDWIIAFNKDPNKTSTVAVNSFADLTPEELTKHMGLIVPSNLGPVPAAEQPDAAFHAVTVADSVDWRKDDKVRPVRNQGSCGSCWAFSAVAAIESAWMIAGKSPVDVSVQEMIACVGSSNGCSGGWPVHVFEYGAKKGGFCSAQEWPYAGRNSKCRKCNNVASIPGYYNLRGQEESAIVKGLNIGPVSVAVQSNSRAFMYYKSGVITNQCGTRVDHAITAVGYGTENDKDYYIVRNSWGSNWGENGYVRIQRGKNMCGINLHPSLPKAVPKD